MALSEKNNIYSKKMMKSLHTPIFSVLKKLLNYQNMSNTQNVLGDYSSD